MYRQVHSAPDHDHSPDANASTSDINYHRTSEQSSTPLQPLMASRLHRNPTSQEKHIHVAATPLNSYPPTPGTLESGDANAQARKRASHFIHEGLSYDPSNAKEDYLRMAKDDIPDNKVARFYLYLLGVSRITRWFLFIVPIAGALWIPAILQWTTFPNGHIWFTSLNWWSIWFTVVWVGWWAALFVTRLLPSIVRNTLGVVSITVRFYSDWLKALYRYIALFVWSLTIWVTFNQLIVNRQHADITPKSRDAVSFCAKLLFALMICTAILLGEKVAIQAIASQFHERSYADRIEEQQQNTRTLVALYSHSTDQVGRSDTLHDNPDSKGTFVDPEKVLKNILKGVKGVAQTTTHAFGNIASEIVGSSVLQPNSPEAMIATALGSANKTRLLARRLFYSFRKPSAEVLVVGDIAPFFHSQDEAAKAFAMFDKDLNGDATRDEMELACMELHRERLALASSMRDIDSAVGRLDNILMSVYTIVVGIVFAVILDTAVSAMLSGAAAFVLALSWLIGASAQEVLSSVIFLFIKHIYDVGDRVEIDGQPYTVKEIRLLSTIFFDIRGCIVQAPHVVLNTKFIYNMRRSQQMSEPFAFDVAFDTTFEQIEELRSRMLAFVKLERRDFLPLFDVTVDNFPDQSKLSLKADIKYKSNWQQGALKVQRRNKWICALKTTLNECKIYGPSGNPAAPPPPSEVTLVPWEEVKASKAPSSSDTDVTLQDREPRVPRGQYQFADRNQVVLDQGQDVWGETREVTMTAPKQTARPQERGGRPTAEGAFAGHGGQHGGQGAPGTSGASAAMPVAAVFAVESIQNIQ